jgi:hypothetical protein
MRARDSYKCNMLLPIYEDCRGLAGVWSVPPNTALSNGGLRLVCTPEHLRISVAIHNDNCKSTMLVELMKPMGPCLGSSSSCVTQLVVHPAVRC